MARPVPGGIQSSAFDAYFAEEWGPRWPALSAALSQRTQHCALINTLIPLSSITKNHTTSLREALPLSSPAQWIPPHLAPTIAALDYAPPIIDTPTETNTSKSAEFKYPLPLKDDASGLTQWYWLDPASIFPPLVLGVVPGLAVLDMCAAPGGKSLVLAQLLLSQQLPIKHEYLRELDEKARNVDSPVNSSLLVCNELDPKRRLRLLSIIKQYIPQDALYTTVKVTGKDGKWWLKNEECAYDRVLIDAPCSSERHVLQQATSRGNSNIVPADWTLRRCQDLAKEQVKLVLAGMRALKIGGILVYSTCSIASIENDEVVDKVLERLNDNTRSDSDDNNNGVHINVLSSPSPPLDVAEVISHLESFACSFNTSSSSRYSDANSNPQSLIDSEGLDPRFVHLGAPELEALGAERTRHGWLLLPDQTGWGPIYLAVLQKKGATSVRRVKVNKYAGMKMNRKAEE